MVKHTQTIRRQFADELIDCVGPFCESALKGLSNLPDFLASAMFLAPTCKWVPF